MPVLLLLPCSAQKRLKPSVVMRENEYDVAPPDFAAKWLEKIHFASPQTTVSTLYKGPAWSLALDIHRSITSTSGSVLVVSAGLGLVKLTDRAPGYDITLSGGTPTTAPGCATSRGRAEWWTLLGGPESLCGYVASDLYTSVIAALPSAYVDAVVSTFARLAFKYKNISFSIMCTRPSRFARSMGKGLIVEVDPRRIRPLGGTVACAPQIALRYVLRQLSTNDSLSRETIATAISTLPQVEALYPRRKIAGLDHARRWLEAKLHTPKPPKSATAALRGYRAAGFAYEQRAFHKLFESVSVEVTLPSTLADAS